MSESAYLELDQPSIKGDNPVLKLRSKQFAAITLPLILGGCGLPVAFSIASFVADGVSLVATEKTLTDHGLSIIANQDCAMWRVVKGEDICSENVDSDSSVMIASNQDIENLPEPEPVAVDDEVIAANKIDEKKSGAGQITVAPLGFIDDAPVIMASKITPPPTKPTIQPLAKWAPTTVATVTQQHLEPAPVRPKAQIVKASFSSSAPQETRTFYVIASYHRLKDAERFAKKQTKLGTQVLSGKAKGKSVFRVAIGPVSSSNRSSTKQGLIKSGYHDVWALKLKKPKVIVEIASLQ